MCDTWAVDGVLQVLTLEPMLEQQLLEAVRPGEQGGVLALPPMIVERIVDGTLQVLAAAEREGNAPVLVCAPTLSSPVRRLLAPHAPRLPVLSYSEIDTSLTIQTTGVVSGGAAIAA